MKETMYNTKIFLISKRTLSFSQNQLEPYQDDVKIETLEVLINQLINSETTVLLENLWKVYN